MLYLNNNKQNKKVDRYGSCFERHNDENVILSHAPRHASGGKTESSEQPASERAYERASERERERERFLRKCWYGDRLEREETLPAHREGYGGVGLDDNGQ